VWNQEKHEKPGGPVRGQQLLTQMNSTAPDVRFSKIKGWKTGKGGGHPSRPEERRRLRKEKRKPPKGLKNSGGPTRPNRGKLRNVELNRDGLKQKPTQANRRNQFVSRGTTRREETREKGIGGEQAKKGSEVAKHNRKKV